MARPLDELGAGRGWKSLVSAPVRGLARTLVSAGLPRQAFYPYFNLVAARTGTVAHATGRRAREGE
jgi:hypothetical protein